MLATWTSVCIQLFQCVDSHQARTSVTVISDLCLSHKEPRFAASTVVSLTECIRETGTAVIKAWVEQAEIVRHTIRTLQVS